MNLCLLKQIRDSKLKYALKIFDSLELFLFSVSPNRMGGGETFFNADMLRLYFFSKNALFNLGGGVKDRYISRFKYGGFRIIGFGIMGINSILMIIRG